MSNIIGLPGTGSRNSGPERYPEFQFEINYTIEGADPDYVTGFMTVMGGYYFIGTGTKPNHELQVDSQVDWLWSAPEGAVRSVKALGPAKTTTKLDA